MDRPKGLILAWRTPAAGRWPLCETLPALVPVANKPVLLHQLERLREAGIEEVAIVARASLRPPIRRALNGIRELGLRVTYIAQPARAGPLDAVLAAESFAGGSPLVVQCGAVLIDHDLEESVVSVASRSLDVLAVGEPAEVTRPTEINRRRIAALATMVKGAERIADVDALVLGAGVLEAVRGLPHEPEDVNAGVAIFSGFAEAGARVEAQAVTRWSKRIDGMAEVLDANRHMLEDVQGEYGDASLTEVTIQEQVRIDSTAKVETSLLRGPVVVGPGAYVGDAYIGPYTSIGANSYIESVEMEHCVIFPGANIGHVGIRLEGSVIGRDAQVSQDITPPRALRLWIGDSADVTVG